MEIVLTILMFTAMPLAAVSIVGTVRWAYARRKRPPRPDRPEPGLPRNGHLLSVTHPDDVPAVPAAVEAGNEAGRVNADVQRAHTGAWLAYASIVVWTYVTQTSLTFDDNVRFAIGYGILAPQLLILLWEIRLSHRRRLLVFLVYMTMGAALLLLTASPALAGKIALYVGVVAVLPVGVLLAVFIRWFRPYLVPLIFLAVYLAGFGILVERYSLAATVQGVLGVSPWLPFLGIAHFVLGIVVALVWWRQQWPVRAIGAAAGLIAAALLEYDFSRHSLPVVVRAACFLGVGILQIVIVRAVFRFFVWLQEHRNSTNALMLCWALLTGYYVVSTVGQHTFYADPAAVRRFVLLALAVHIVLLHLLLFRIRRRRPPLATKRLLFLGVFGDRREKLLEDLNDFWRRIGAVDLLALHTLEARILAVFGLSARDERPLRTAAEVDEQIAGHRPELDTDMRYLVNALHCDDEDDRVWPYAFARLVEGAHVVLMDLRGFTLRNRGCRDELKELLKQEQRPPIVVLVQSPGDLETMRRIVADEPRDFTILDYDPRSTAERRALLQLLMNGAFGP